MLLLKERKHVMNALLVQNVCLEQLTHHLVHKATTARLAQ